MTSPSPGDVYFGRSGTLLERVPPLPRRILRTGRFFRKNVKIDDFSKKSGSKTEKKNLRSKKWTIFYSFYVFPFKSIFSPVYVRHGASQSPFRILLREYSTGTPTRLGCAWEAPGRPPGRPPGGPPGRRPRRPSRRPLGRPWKAGGGLLHPSNTPGMALEASWEALRTLDRTLEHSWKILRPFWKAFSTYSAPLESPIKLPRGTP